MQQRRDRLRYGMCRPERVAAACAVVCAQLEATTRAVLEARDGLRHSVSRRARPRWEPAVAMEA